MPLETHDHIHPCFEIVAHTGPALNNSIPFQPNEDDVNGNEDDVDNNNDDDDDSDDDDIEHIIMIILTINDYRDSTTIIIITYFFIETSDPEVATMVGDGEVQDITTGTVREYFVAFLAGPPIWN